MEFLDKNLTFRIVCFGNRNKTKKIEVYEQKMFNDKKVLRRETVMHLKNNPRLKYEVVLDCSQSILEV